MRRHQGDAVPERSRMGSLLRRLARGDKPKREKRIAAHVHPLLTKIEAAIAVLDISQHRHKLENEIIFWRFWSHGTPTDKKP